MLEISLLGGRVKMDIPEEEARKELEKEGIESFGPAVKKEIRRVLRIVDVEYYRRNPTV